MYSNIIMKNNISELNIGASARNRAMVFAVLPIATASVTETGRLRCVMNS